MAKNPKWLEARDYFGIADDSNLILHHKDPTLKYNDPVRYNEWNPEDLVVMTLSDHIKLHNSGEGNPMYGKPAWNKGLTKETDSRVAELSIKQSIAHQGKTYSAEHREAISKSLRGKPRPNSRKHWKLIEGRRVFYD